MTQLSPRSHPRHLVGKKTALKDAIKDTTSDSQVNKHAEQLIYEDGPKVSVTKNSHDITIKQKPFKNLFTDLFHRYIDMAGVL